MTTETFNTFHDINHTPLRAFNRAIMLGNIREDFGEVKAKEYIEKFSQAERKQMYVILMSIKTRGYKATKDSVTKGMDYQDV